MQQRINPRDIPVVILAGGRGTRLMEETHVIPKPMVTIGGVPILLHIIRYYASYGFRDFVVCLGYKGNVIRHYFLDLARHSGEVKVIGPGDVGRPGAATGRGWRVVLAETGEQSLTSTRLRRVRSCLRSPHFCLTYGDGLGDINLLKEFRFHLQHGKIGTVAAVHPPSRFGKLELAGPRVRSFKEKDRLKHDYINGGFFMFRREMLGRLSSTRNESLEGEPLSRLARNGQLCAFRHEGFWKCMDTLRDREELEDVYAGGCAPWVRW